MKKIMTMVAFALIGGIGASAQTVYDAAKFINKDLTGTARFIGMGGAMGALGGDISTIGTNPAGIGIYRSNDFMTTMSYSMNSTESKYAGMKFNEDKNKFSFNNVGMVLSTKVGDHTPLRFVNFGFNYKRTKSFYKNMTMEGVANTMNGLRMSQTYQMAHLANGTKENLGGDNVFYNNHVSWLAALGWNGYLLNQDEEGYYSIAGDDYYSDPYMMFNSREGGGIDNYDFNISFNFSDRFYLGVTIGGYDVNYRKFSDYEEFFTDDEGYYLNSTNYIDGTGFDVKLGMIVRPFEYSPLRLGLAVHTPTFYKLTYSTEAAMIADVYDSEEDKIMRHEIYTYDELGGRWMDREFKLQTPWVFNFSLGYTVGTDLALGAEYEYEDYSSMKFKYPDNGGTMSETYVAKQMTKGVSTFRLGAEYKVAPEFAVRLGYNYSTAIFEKDAWKDLPYNSINTDTDYANSKGISNYTLGFGYRGSNFYADLAYKYNNYKEDFYAFDSSDLVPTKVTNNNHQIFLTLGMRF